jgi:hypothetical protein
MKQTGFFLAFVVFLFMSRRVDVVSGGLDTAVLRVLFTDEFTAVTLFAEPAFCQDWNTSRSWTGGGMYWILLSL